MQRACLERGLIIEKGGREGSVLRFLPPIIISFEEIDFALRVMREAVISTAGPMEPQLTKENMLAEWKQHFIHTGPGGADSFEASMNKVTHTLKQIFEQADAPYSGMDPKVLASLISQQQMGETPLPLDTVIEQTGDLIGRNSILVQHPHCIAHLHTPPMLPAVVAEAFITALNQSMDSWDQASAATYVEQKVVDWLAEQYELGGGSDGIFTSGATQSNLMGLLIARDNAVKKISGESVQKQGLPSYADKLRIVCSGKTHFTVQKSASLLGLGESSVVCVGTKENGAIEVTEVQETVAALKAEGLIPFAVVGTAGTTDHGAIDDLAALADIAEIEDLWFHVDAAYGGALVLSRHKSRLKGIERADSLSVDFHKLFFQPISCGAVLLKDGLNFNYLLHHADYLNREDDVLPNLVDKSIATTRRFDALKVLMTMQNVGPQALGNMVDHLINQAQQVADIVGHRPEFELLADPALSTVLFRYVGMACEGINTCQFNRQLRLEALVKGDAVLGETTVNGKAALKFTILNPCLEMAHFEQLLDNISQLADSMSGQISAS
ncbi:hypothetical protein CS022_21550 [Veronia nyctiphanis]|uniref:L-2,4-diaminobutyrate decarboxylase n=1 Tax=Veronia nyctiphanis TaxID=1278244 RepID=A0A4Q0YQ48_9GAMM|nr:hypothetical protein CS022_21550 [Veronia nyctiphanis]